MRICLLFIMTLVNMKSVVALFIKSKEQPSVKMSPELRKNIYSPEAKSTALFIALYIPLSGSDIQECDTRCVFTNDIDTVISGSAVYDNILEV